MANIAFDAAQFLSGLGKMTVRMEEAARKAELSAAGEVLRLSTLEVPHDKGLLQDSGSYGADQGDGQGAYVGYNKVYAAHLHENPQFHFQKGRKGKFLEDPMKNNTSRLGQFMADAVQEVI